MSQRISNDLSAEISSVSVEITSQHGGNIVVDSDEIPALIAFLESVQHCMGAGSVTEWLSLPLASTNVSPFIGVLTKIYSRPLSNVYFNEHGQEVYRGIRPPDFCYSHSTSDGFGEVCVWVSTRQSLAPDAANGVDVKETGTTR